MLPNLILSKTYDSSYLKWCIAPATLGQQSKFLILTETEAEADSIINSVAQNLLKTPDLDPSNWTKISSIASTPVFELNKQAIIGDTIESLTKKKKEKDLNSQINHYHTTEEICEHLPEYVFDDEKELEDFLKENPDDFFESCGDQKGLGWRNKIKR